MVRWLLAPLAAIAALGAGSVSAAVGIVLEGEGAGQAFVVRGLSGEQVGRLKAVAAGEVGFSGVLKVSVSGSEEPMLGGYALTGDGVRFEPRFPLTAGHAYVATFRMGSIGSRAAVVTREFRIADEPKGEVARVSAVYPSADVLPENLLKFYLHFSRPMSGRDSYRHLHLLDGEKEVELPFLELGEELWNEEFTRLTVLFDPGRIKRGVKPQEDVGEALVAGREYTLVIDAAMRDAKGQPLAAGFRKVFRVGPADRESPSAGRCKVTAPEFGTKRPLVVEFDEALDHAMLGRVLSVESDDYGKVRGEVTIGGGERRWEFRPAEAWERGWHDLRVETILEDLAGNSLGRAFEEELWKIPREMRSNSAGVTGRSFETKRPASGPGDGGGEEREGKPPG